MKETPTGNLDMRVVMSSLDPVRRYVGYDVGQTVQDLEKSMDPNVHVIRHPLGEVGITLTDGKFEYFYRLRNTDGILRVRTLTKRSKIGDTVKKRVDKFFYGKGKIVKREAFENGVWLYTDKYSDSVFNLTTPDVPIPVFDVERSYPRRSGKPKNNWTIEDILTGYFPESWAKDAFRSFIDSDPFLPQYKDETELTREFDAKNHLKVEKGQIVERIIRFPTLPPDRRIKATLRVDQWFPDAVKLSLVKTELIDAPMR